MSSSSDAAAAGIVIVMIAIMCLALLAYVVLAIIGVWKMFKKAGRPGWASIIPFYNVWVLGDIVFQSKGKKIGYLVSTIAYTVLAGMSGTTNLTMTLGSSTYSYSSSAVSGNAVVSGLLTIAAIAYLVFSILAAISTAKAYGKGGGFAVGLIFLGPIFYMILGFSKNIFYIGPEGIPANGVYPPGAYPQAQQPYAQMPQGQAYQPPQAYQPQAQPYQAQPYQQPQQAQAQPQTQAYQPQVQPQAQPYQQPVQQQPTQQPQAQPQYPQYPQYPQQ